MIAVNLILRLAPWWWSQLRTMPWNPRVGLVALDSAILVMTLLPWAVASTRIYWAIEGAWLDKLDPAGAKADARTAPEQESGLQGQSEAVFGESSRG